MTASFVALLDHWQSLVSGLLAVGGGAFVLIQGKFDREERARERLADQLREVSEIDALLLRLRALAKDFLESLRQYQEAVSDVAQALDRGEVEVDLPRPIKMTTVFSLILAQLTTKAVPPELYLLLSRMIEQANSAEDDMRRLLIALGKTVTEHRSPELGFWPDERKVSTEPAVDNASYAAQALADLVDELIELIDHIVVRRTK
ncbi:hypothetical protein [Sphingomonas sp. 28-63-12]|uniref:hypothetical protein n=1 Tax=Sphingomonas sp. 28-63-12 TaxID=1970434 RepID=UPI000BCD9D1E|nr:MAG: hypothetical protein B7Y47_05755 [Sphingomonas sp. 28-63-12]